MRVNEGTHSRVQYGQGGSDQTGCRARKTNDNVHGQRCQHLNQHAKRANAVARRRCPSIDTPLSSQILTGIQPYYRKGGLIPHLTKKGCFWKSTPPAIVSKRQALRHVSDKERLTEAPAMLLMLQLVPYRVQVSDPYWKGMSMSSWLNTLLEKHAWLSAGLVWLQGASMSAECGVFDETPSKDSEPRPTINLFEQWEEGAHMPKVANARDFAFPTSLAVPCMPLLLCA